MNTIFSYIECQKISHLVDKNIICLNFVNESWHVYLIDKLPSLIYHKYTNIFTICLN